MKPVTVFCDLDGVIVDWMNAMAEYTNKPANIYDEFYANPESFCETRVDELYGGRSKLKELMLERPVEFWSDLKMFPWANKLICCLSLDFELCFLTSPGSNPNAAKGKLIWQQTNFPSIPIIIAKQKSLVSAPDKVLIDDNDRNLTLFDERGGLALKWPNQFNMAKLEENEYDPLIDKYVENIHLYENSL